MKGIYLGAYEALHPNYDIVYQDINGKRDLDGDMLDVDLTSYDFIICTPPCNFWSRARGNRCSQYSLSTRHLLPAMIEKLIDIGKPFIIENVRNDKRFYDYGILPQHCCFVYKYNRHTYFTNVKFDISKAAQRQDFKYGGKVILYHDMNNKKHQGGFNVHNVIEEWLHIVHSNNLVATNRYDFKSNVIYTLYTTSIKNI